MVQNRYRNEDKESLKRSISAECKIDPNLKWVTIAMTDGISFLNKRQVSQIIGKGVPENKFIRNIEIVSDQIIELFAWINSFNCDEENENFIFILRPHPSIGVEDYLNFIKNNSLDKPKNLVFEKKYLASDWIYVSDYYLTNYSTLALDALSLKIPSCYIDPATCPSPYYYWWLDKLTKITSYDDFKEFFINNDNTEHASKFTGKSNSSIDQTSKVILSALNDSQGNSSLTLKTLLMTPLAIIIFFRRVAGSLIRNILAVSGISEKTNIMEGLRHDYFAIETENEILADEDK